MRLRIMEIEEGVIRRGRGPRRITPSEKWSVRHFSFYNENNSISSPGLLG